MWRCTIRPGLSDFGDIDTDCATSVSGKMLNGITPTADRLDLLTVDTMGQGVHQFRRWPNGVLKKYGYIELNHKGDNIMYDPNTNAYYVGSIGKLSDLGAIVSTVKQGKQTPI